MRTVLHKGQHLKSIPSRYGYSVHIPISKCYYGTSNNEKEAVLKPPAKEINHISVLLKLTKYIWPKENGPDQQYIKNRVVASLALLVASKTINIYVPFIFKNLVDNFQSIGTLSFCLF